MMSYPDSRYKWIGNAYRPIKPGLLASFFLVSSVIISPLRNLRKHPENQLTLGTHQNEATLLTVFPLLYNCPLELKSKQSYTSKQTEDETVPKKQATQQSNDQRHRTAGPQHFETLTSIRVRVACAPSTRHDLVKARGRLVRCEGERGRD